MFRKYLLKTEDGRKNICGTRIREFRLAQPEPVSQRMLADEFQRHGLDMDKYIVKNIENGSRCVTDIELSIIADVLGTSVDQLLR